MKICVICGNEFEEFGNNPWPITKDNYNGEEDDDKGRCCDWCN